MTAASDSRKSVLDAIDAYLARTGMTPAAFGKAAVKNRRFVENLRNGADMLLETADKALAFVGAEPIGPRFRAEVEAYIGAAGAKPYLFGEQAVGDPSFVARLFGETSPRLGTVDRVRAWMAANASAAERKAMRDAVVDRTVTVSGNSARTRKMGKKKMNDRYLKTGEAADLLGLSARTLDRYRVTGAGPVFHKFGNSVRYRRTDIDKWADERKQTSTSDVGSRDRGARPPAP